MKFKLFLLLTFLVAVNGKSDQLEEVSEEELLSLLRNEKYVIVLFSKKNCKECDDLEQLLVNLREDLVETLNPWVVKAMDTNMVKLYNPAKEPSLVFFRHGIPMLYDGDYNEDLILHTFSDNKDPVVKELSDNNFEHLTQAASGATTGDWFIMFYSNDCIDCQRMQARWESVASKLKTRMNIARINRKTTGRVTARRFGVIEEPMYILFRLGKMYRYNLPKYDVPTFVSFAQEWYKNARGEKVPLPKTPFDDLLLAIVDYMREYSYQIKVFIISGVAAVLILIVMVMKKSAPKPEKSKKAKSSTATPTDSEKTKKVK